MFLDDGLIPTNQQFITSWISYQYDKYCFVNDDRMGTCILNRDQLWNEILTIYNEMIEIEAAPYFDSRLFIHRYEWLKKVLGSLGINWK